MGDFFVVVIAAIYIAIAVFVLGMLWRITMALESIAETLRDLAPRVSLPPRGDQSQGTRH